MLTTTVGGAEVLNTTLTVPHWFGSTLDPQNGVTYGHNIVGADPNNCSGADCYVTVTVDIIPLNVIVGGESFNCSDAVNATLASPVFALNDYGSTPFATSAPIFPNLHVFPRGPGGVLSQNDAGNQLQLVDATMRAQFNKTGSSSYHLRLNPVVHDAITIVVPQNLGSVFQNARGVHIGDINFQWWDTRIQNLNASLGYIDPTHIALYLTKDVALFLMDEATADVDAQKKLDDEGVRVMGRPQRTQLITEGAIAVVTEHGQRYELDALYPALGCVVRSELATALGAGCNENGNLIVDDHQRTTVDRLYAAGDVVTDLHQLSVAFGHAAIAATDIQNRLPHNPR